MGIKIKKQLDKSRPETRIESAVLAHNVHNMTLQQQLTDFLLRSPIFRERLPHMVENGYRCSTEFEIFLSNSVLQSFFQLNDNTLHCCTVGSLDDLLTIQAIDTQDQDFQIDFHYHGNPLAQLKFEYLPMDERLSYRINCRSHDRRLENILRDFCRDLKNLNGAIQL